ncbi:MAG: hypothetical protein JWR55_1397 [Aeromicrobium sp.]|jgi:hypothetical protein|nr:hypothetical protein [Aeromicrobium sp.]
MNRPSEGIAVPPQLERMLMTRNTISRSFHDLGLAAWFG